MVEAAISTELKLGDEQDISSEITCLRSTLPTRIPRTSRGQMGPTGLELGSNWAQAGKEGFRCSPLIAPPPSSPHAARSRLCIHRPVRAARLPR
jgi:hypothetical protein